jgi:hypothetical protein
MQNTGPTASVQWLPETGTVIVTYRGKQYSLEDKAHSYEEALMLANSSMKEHDEALRRVEGRPESTGWA